MTVCCIHEVRGLTMAHRVDGVIGTLAEWRRRVYWYYPLRLVSARYSCPSVATASLVSTL